MDTNYYITFIDDYSRKCWIYWLKHKSEAVLKILLSFINLSDLTCKVFNYILKILAINEAYSNEKSNISWKSRGKHLKIQILKKL